MKKALLIATIAFCTNSFSQPVIQNGNNIPSAGASALLYTGTAAGIGNPGANQVWDFSAVAFSATTVTWTVVSPSSTPYFSSFPSSNYAWTLTSQGPTKYFYFDVTSTKFDVLADNILTPGSGNDYTPDSKTALQFPSNYGDTFTDTYQKVGGSVNNTTVTYDGYGTLITPYATYTNVWRVKQDDGGVYVTYTWENENPLQPILIYNQSNNSFTMFGNSPLNAINEHKSSELSVNLYPNPAKGKLSIEVSDLPLQGRLNLNLLDVVGQTIKQVAIHSKSTTVELDNVIAGIYFYQLQDETHILKTGKIIVE